MIQMDSHKLHEMMLPHANISFTGVPGLDRAKGGLAHVRKGSEDSSNWKERRGKDRAPALLLRQDNSIYFYHFFFKENIIPRKLIWIRGKVSGLT